MRSRRTFVGGMAALVLAGVGASISWSNPGKEVVGKAAGAEPKAGAAEKKVDPDSLLPQDGNYIVHEWGTFTSFSGSDGISLDFRPLVDEDLPQFVMDRQKQAFMNERREIAYSRGRTDKGLVISRQRMETPVTYFYTDQERIVEASVEFPKGLLTEFYPPVRQFGPAFKKGAAEPLEGSWLRWGKVRLLPAAKAVNEAGVDPFMPKVKPGEGHHYAHAREVDAAHIQLTDPGMGMTYREKFLFYRGVGNFSLPVSLKAVGADRFVLNNEGKAPLSWAFLIQVGADKSVRFSLVEDVKGSREIVLPSQGSTMDHLAGHVQKMLMTDGLYLKEALAMVHTWESSWFSEPGTRVLYSLPQSYTDELLPLKLNPAPKQNVRVMVGRLETLTPEQERRIEGLIGKLGSADPAVRAATDLEIRKLGRFAEPALTRVSKVTGDPEVREKARMLLREVLVSKGIPVMGMEVKK
jgi:hypothetical protein